MIWGMVCILDWAGGYEEEGLFPHTWPHKEEPANRPRFPAATVSPVGILPLGSALPSRRERTGVAEVGL